ncbi:hypothetical protein CYMTET_13729, partial [Cymbomonas tetramitiformis]
RQGASLLTIQARVREQFRHDLKVSGTPVSALSFGDGASDLTAALSSLQRQLERMQQDIRDLKRQKREGAPPAGKHLTRSAAKHHRAGVKPLGTAPPASFDKKSGRWFLIRYTAGNEEELMWVDLCPRLLPVQPGWEELKFSLTPDAQGFYSSRLNEHSEAASSMLAARAATSAWQAAPSNLPAGSTRSAWLSVPEGQPVQKSVAPELTSTSHDYISGAGPSQDFSRVLENDDSNDGASNRSSSSTSPPWVRAKEVHKNDKCCWAEGCTKFSQGSTPYCKAHGGGRRCQSEGCPKSAQGTTPFCVAHGGGKRCQVEGCTKSGFANTSFCKAHGTSKC